MAPAPELMVAVESFTSSVPDEIAVKRGLTLPADHDIVRLHPKFFIAHAAGEQAAVERRNEIERAMEQLREKQRADERAARIARGNRIDPSDDAITVAAKTAAQTDARLQLVYDPNGNAIAVRPKP
jgi:hypothetical protein